jgi:ribonuclease E
MRGLDIPDGMGAIVRTAGIGRATEELQWDFNYLLQLWNTITDESSKAKAPHFLFQESNVIVRAIRDYLRHDVGEVIVDGEEAYALAAAFIGTVMPDFTSKVKYYQDEIPLFNRYQIENQIETAFCREVTLPSGGSIVIDITEAMVSIDINSARATKGGDIEETAFNTNKEAAEEIGRQLRLRDVGGLIVIDFIDMLSSRHQKEVENKMRDALEVDRARVQVGRISRFGLLEMSRQRLRPSLEETMSRTCPRCKGQGTIRGTRSLALSILRLVEEEAQKEFTREIRAIVPVPVATFLLNEKRKEILDIESRNKLQVTVLPNTEMETPHFDVVRIRNQDEDSSDFSYRLANELSKAEEEVVSDATAPAAAPVPAVKTLIPSTPAPTVTAPAPAATQDKSPGLVKRLWASMFGETEEKVEEKKPAPRSRNNQNRSRGGRNSRPNQNNRRPNNRNNESRGNDNNQTNDKANDKANDQKANQSNDQKTNQPNDQKNESRNNQNRNSGNRRNRNNKPKDQDNKPVVSADTAVTTATDSASNAPKTDQLQRRPDDKRRGPRRRRQRQDVPQEMLDQTAVILGGEAAKADAKPSAPQESKVEATKDQAVPVAATDTSAPAVTQTVETEATKPKATRTRRKAPAKPKVTQAMTEAGNAAVTDEKPATAPQTEAEPKTAKKPAAKAKPRAVKKPAATKPGDVEAPKEVRASNDPRKKPKPVVKVAVSTERVETPTPAVKAPAAAPAPNPSAATEKPVARASNDPRKKRAAAKPKKAVAEKAATKVDTNTDSTD